MKISCASASDVSKVLPLFHAYRQFYRHDIDPRAEAFLKDRLSNKESIILFAEDSDGVQGFVQIYPTFSSRRLGSIWTLNDLYVKPDARRKKLAWKLMDECMKMARENQILAVGLSTQISNINAQEFYKKYGFKKDNDFFYFNYNI